MVVPLAVAGVAATSLAVARALWWPGSSLLLAVVRGICALMAVGGGVQLGIFSRGRRQVGPWVLIAMLLLLHMDQDTTSPHFLAGIDMVIELLLGLSMLVMVLDDSKQRTDRLGAVNAISGAMAGAQEHWRDGADRARAIEEIDGGTRGVVPNSRWQQAGADAPRRFVGKVHPPASSPGCSHRRRRPGRAARRSRHHARRLPGGR